MCVDVGGRVWREWAPLHQKAGKRPNSKIHSQFLVYNYPPLYRLYTHQIHLQSIIIIIHNHLRNPSAKRPISNQATATQSNTDKTNTKWSFQSVVSHVEKSSEINGRNTSNYYSRIIQKGGFFLLDFNHFRLNKVSKRLNLFLFLIQNLHREALDALELKRYCCRRMVLTHVDLIEKLLHYNSMYLCLSFFWNIEW